MHIEITRLVSGAVSLVGLGLVMGFSPSLYAVVLHLLTGTPRPARLIRWLALGVGLGATVLLFIFWAFDPDVITALLEARTRSLLVHRSVDLTAGVVFLLLGLWTHRRARLPQKPPRKPGAGDERPHRMLVIGLLSTMIGVSGPATMYVTGRVIRGASHEPLLDLPLYATFLVGLVGPYLLAAGAWQKFPRAADRIKAWAAWAARQDVRPLVALGLFLAGLVFLALGAWGHGGLGA